MERLETADRDTFVLRFLEGLELHEIASAMNVSLSTVRRNLRRASDRVDALLRRDPLLGPQLQGDRRPRPKSPR
jgi:RNA polymerase sigma-70 factor (ECF subfamily)